MEVGLGRQTSPNATLHVTSNPPLLISKIPILAASLSEVEFLKNKDFSNPILKPQERTKTNLNLNLEGPKGTNVQISKDILNPRKHSAIVFNDKSKQKSQNSQSKGTPLFRTGDTLV